MTHHPVINYQLAIKLPVSLVAKSDQMSNVLTVQTPHKGIVIVELKEVDKGLFRKATEVERPTRDVLDQLFKIEREAYAFLMDRWLENEAVNKKN